jgi:CO/xanthine dehydrogenase FAD-binding subunit
MLINPLTYHSPKSLKEATQLYATLGDVKILAGGTFLLNSLKLLKRKGTKTTANILSLRKIEELKGVKADDQAMTIGAMTIINDLFDSPLLTDNFKVLHTVCRNISTNPIRNMATVGGNLTCRYTWTEMGAVMIAFDAQMHFMDAEGKESSVSAEDFFKNAARADKIFTHVTLKRDKTARFAYRRVRKTMHVDVPLLAVCVKTNFKEGKLTNSRVTVNNGTAFAQRDYILEKFLENAPARLETAQEALDHLDTNIYDKRSDDYKSHMFRVSIKSALAELINGQKS